MLKLMRDLPLLQALADTHRRVLLEPGLPPLHQDTGADHWQTALALPELAGSFTGAGVPDAWTTSESADWDVLRPGELRILLPQPKPELGGAPARARLPAQLWGSQLTVLQACDGQLAQVLREAALQAWLHLSLCDVDDWPTRLNETWVCGLLRWQYLIVHPVASAWPYVGACLACNGDETQGVGLLCAGLDVIAVGGLQVASDTQLVNAHRTQVLAQIQQAKP